MRGRCNGLRFDAATAPPPRPRPSCQSQHSPCEPRPLNIPPPFAMAPRVPLPSSPGRLTSSPSKPRRPSSPCPIGTPPLSSPSMAVCPRHPRVLRRLQTDHPCLASQPSSSSSCTPSRVSTCELSSPTRPPSASSSQRVLTRAPPQLGMVHFARLRVVLPRGQEAIPLPGSESPSASHGDRTRTAHSCPPQVFYFLNRYCLLFTMVGL